MSKQEIDQTMTKARIARAKKARETAETAEAEAAASTTVNEPSPREKGGRKHQETTGEPKTPTKDETPKAKPPREDLVVFAFRLTAAERDLIHKAAGAAKASRYARTLLVAASRGEVKLVSEITASIGEELKAAS